MVVVIVVVLVVVVVVFVFVPVVAVIGCLKSCGYAWLFFFALKWMSCCHQDYHDAHVDIAHFSSTESFFIPLAWDPSFAVKVCCDLPSTNEWIAFPRFVCLSLLLQSACVSRHLCTAMNTCLH